ncbi:prephenate dehydratase domain-containing protein [Sphingosinicella sp. LHD-64]|uniref:prephenate dehydratase domain-containing protein n=1 Tax=Sphingosinicella sp. LHD-64 TaxID=3072139 RepID=UPI00280D6B58|nr:prephenate dehydratase domain-containing protein [Sphingosinicella sp. LHD-64]MDQ8755571.1 prephenate dehydratase domain-containing protein [Sphingosinicella sp. LHD-64]
MKVAYQGVPGAFSWEACRTFLPEWTPVPRATFANVIKAVQAGAAGRGMLPVRNSTAGPVPGVEDLIRESGLLIVGRHRLPIRLHLLGLPDAELEGIVRVTSHPMALAQCVRWREEAGVTAEDAPNTAMAAEALAESGDPAIGVIASEVAAEAYGLRILKRDIQDREDNATTFCVVARDDGEQP